MVCYDALLLHAHAGVGMHVLETLRGQPPLHGTYMFLSLFAGLGVGHFMTGLCCTGNKLPVFGLSSNHRVALHIFRSSPLQLSSPVDVLVID